MVIDVVANHLDRFWPWQHMHIRESICLYCWNIYKLSSNRWRRLVNASEVKGGYGEFAE